MVLPEKILPTLSREALAEYAALVAIADEARRTGNIPEAESSYVHAIAVNARGSEALVSVGHLFADTLRWEKAEKAFREALSIVPGNVDVEIALSRVLVTPVASADLSVRYDEAERLARTAVRMGNRTAAFEDQLGAALERRGLIGTETEAAYRRAIGADPTYAAAYAHLARLLRRNGKGKEAMAAYSSATANAVDAWQMTDVARSFQSEQRIVESLPLLMNAVHLDQRNYTALVLLGRALAVTGDTQRAESYLIIATRVSPFSYAAFGELGRLYLREDKPERAETVFKHAESFADVFERVDLAGEMESVGDLYAKRTNWKGAEDAFRSSIVLDPGRISATDKLARYRH